MTKRDAGPRSARHVCLALLVALSTAAVSGRDPARASVAEPAGLPAPELLSFGDASGGQLARRPDEDGDQSSAPTAVALPGQQGAVVQVATGGAHSLAVTASGQLYAFGDNYFGELGSMREFRQKVPNPAPMRVELPGASGPVLEAAAGSGFSLARTASGQLYAFGDDRLGELGFTFPIALNGRAEPFPSPVPIPSGSGPVAQVGAGTNFAVALTASGSVYSWGANQYGQLGQARNEGDEDAANPTPLPVAMPAGAGRVTQIAAGGSHVLAVTSSGQLYGWGADGAGQTGATPSPSGQGSGAVPHLIVLPAGAGAIAQIAAGTQDSVVLTGAGQIYTFGDNSSGQLGRERKVVASKEALEATPTPVALPGEIGTATKIEAGGAQTFVQTSGGQLYGFGSNLYGELGVLTNFDDGRSYSTPIPLTFPGLSDLVAVGGGANASASFVTAAPQAPAGAPALSGLQITRRAVELNHRGQRCYTPWGAIHHCSRTTPLQISYALDRNATVTFVLERRATSRLRDGVCEQEGATRTQRCSYLVLLGKFVRPVTAQTDNLVFHGLVDGRVLTPGEYRLTAFAQGGGLTGAPQSAWFQVAP
jgi:alpha-tubulin suppressor-like RCC1 family protein